MLERIRNLKKSVMQKDWALSLNIQQQGPPQQNAFVERAFPTLMGRATAMMNFAGFTTEKRKQLWCEVANTATMLDKFWCMNKIMHHPTLCFMDRMRNMPSIYKLLVRFV